jgi:hypothetical protein
MHKGSALEIPQTLSKFFFVPGLPAGGRPFRPGCILLAHLIAPRIYGASREAISAGGRPRLGSAWIQGNVTKMGG